MEWRRRSGWLGLVLAAAAGACGCTDALTVHPVVTYTAKAPVVPVLTGTWIARPDEPDDMVATLEIIGNETGLGQCRPGRVTLTLDDESVYEGEELCFFDFNGHLVAETKTPPPLVFYRQFLVRAEQDRIAVCGMFPVWVLLRELQEEGTTGYSLETLQYTVRKGNLDDLTVVISEPSDLRAFLELALPELASACDSGESAGKPFRENAYTWVRFERAPPEDAEGDAEEQGDR